MNIPELLKMRADKYDRLSLSYGLASTCTSAWVAQGGNGLKMFSGQTVPKLSGLALDDSHRRFALTKVGLLGTAFCQTLLKDPTCICKHNNVPSTAQLRGHCRNKLGTWRRQKCHLSSQAGSHLPQRLRSQVSF